MTCTASKPCSVLNCMFEYFPVSENKSCIPSDKLKSHEEESLIYDDDSEEHFLNFVHAEKYMTINGKAFYRNFALSLKETNAMNYDNVESCDKKVCTRDKNKVCRCKHEKKLPYNKTIQMVLTNFNMRPIMHTMKMMNMNNMESHEHLHAHPIHFHGHSFHVLKIGHSKYNNNTGLRVESTDDIDCADPKCFTTKWRDPKTRGDNIPGLNTRNPPRKDTIQVPAGGYVVIRFKSDNPGKWLMHCHVDFHEMQGKQIFKRIS